MSSVRLCMHKHKICVCVYYPHPPPPRVWSRLQGLVQEQSWDHGGSTAGICPQEAAPAPCSWHWGLHEPGNGTPPQLHPPNTHSPSSHCSTNKKTSLILFGKKYVRWKHWWIGGASFAVHLSHMLDHFFNIQGDSLHDNKVCIVWAVTVFWVLWR